MKQIAEDRWGFKMSQMHKRFESRLAPYLPVFEVAEMYAKQNVSGRQQIWNSPVLNTAHLKEHKRNLEIISVETTRIGILIVAFALYENLTTRL